MIKNLPAMLKTQVQSLGWEDPLEKGMAIHSSILAWRIPMDRGSWWATVHGVAKSRTTTERLSTAQYMFDPGFLNLTTTDSWDLSLFCCGLGWGLFYALQDIKRISHLYTLDASSALLAVTTKNVSRHHPVFPRDKVESCCLNEMMTKPEE